MTLEALEVILKENHLERNELYEKALRLIELFKRLETGVGRVTFNINDNKGDNMISLNSVDIQQEKHREGIMEQLLNSERGNLIKLSVGHNGQLKEADLKTLMFHLENANFLN